jgi:exo-beta-1,3-glucanase (GH17 family)
VSKSNLVIAIGLAAATIAAWALLNRPADEPPWPAAIDGIAFSPVRGTPGSADADYPTTEQIRSDLALLAKYAGSVRTYALDGTLGTIPSLAAEHGLSVTPGVWLDGDRQTNAAQVDKLRKIVARQHNISSVIVGNETVLRGDLSVAELTALLDALRTELDVPVGTAEPWHVWLDHPELARHVDFIAVHILPYWEGIGVDDAVDFVAARMDDLRSAFAGKPIVIGEVGWPTWGRGRGQAVPSAANAEKFLRRFMQRARRAHYRYFLMEAFDQPWKRAEEGEVGAYWGLFSADRRSKFAFAGPLRPLPHWPALAALAALLGVAAYGALVADGGRLRLRWRLFLAVTAAALSCAVVFCLRGYAAQYWTWTSVLSAAVLLGGLAGVIALICVEAQEWAEAHCIEPAGPPGTDPRYAGAVPKVSIHVPAYEEPPAMLLHTLRCLAELDYPRYEVIVVDNNTRDESLWRPVEAFCAAHAGTFRFFHVAPLSGHKAGALNYALERTADDATIVAVVDSDYAVCADWLRELVPAFADPAVAIVQAPQAYRDFTQHGFKAMCEAEYRGFFAIGMVTRAAHNAIIQHGTMTMVRKRVLEEVGGWAQWTITEDAELGLRILEHGYHACYTPRVYGRGLTPDNFHDYKRQRFRWALGAVQILKHHAACLLGVRASALTARQRFHFLAGWLGWLADGFNLVFNVVAVLWSLLMIAAPLRFEPPLATFSGFVLALFCFKLAKVGALYTTRVGAGAARTAGAMLAGLALVFVVGQAVLAGLFCKRARFRRTPKLAKQHSVAGALVAARWETGLAAALLGCAAGTIWTTSQASTDAFAWAALLTVLAVPHAAALALSLSSALPARRREAHDSRLGAPVSETRRG